MSISGLAKTVSSALGPSLAHSKCNITVIILSERMQSINKLTIAFDHLCVVCVSISTGSTSAIQGDGSHLDTADWCMHKTG